VHEQREQHLERAIALAHHFVNVVLQLVALLLVVDGTHVAETEVRVDRNAVAGLAAQQAPYRQPDRLAEDVPQRLLDAGDRRAADHAELPEAVLAHRAHGVLDVTWVMADHERSQILDAAHHGARLPLERRLAPPVKPVLVGLDLHEYPVAHLCIDDEGADGGDLHGVCSCMAA
jgi:hypothetical protein